MDVFIYCLTDPRTKQIRYVGKTINVSVRVRDHQRDGKRRRATLIKGVIAAPVAEEKVLTDSAPEPTVAA